MGTEMKANPGIHLLVIFQESVDPTNVTAFLEDAYGTPYAKIAGDPNAITRWSVLEALNAVRERFATFAIVVFPHIDSDAGVYEGLKEYGQARIGALTHPAVAALSFNKPETRERIRELYKQRDYSRQDEVALIQASDFHGGPGAIVGQPRTEVRVPQGKATYKNLREALRCPSRVKCSIDFTEDEYQRLTRKTCVWKFTSHPGKLGFQDQDYDAASAAICAMSNSDGGVLELQGSVAPTDDREVYLAAVQKQLDEILKGRLDPQLKSYVYRDFRFSPGRVSIVIRLFQSQRLHTSNGVAYTMKDDRPTGASARDIEFLVSRNISTRFGPRFESTLNDLSTRSILLSKMPRGIPLLLRCHEKLTFSLPEGLTVSGIPPASSKGREASEEFAEILAAGSDAFPFGYPEGNCALLWQPRPPRFEEHYLRFTVIRAQVDGDTLERCAWGSIDSPAIVVVPGGGVGLLEPGHIIADIGALLIRVSGEWQDRVHSLLAWFKSAFFIWHCAVHLGDPDLFLHLQFPGARLALPRSSQKALYQRLDALARNVVLDENKFMSEINRQKKKGTLDDAGRERLMVRHNANANRTCLDIDKAIFEWLAVGKDDERFVARTLRDVHMSDFGLLEELSKK